MALVIDGIAYDGIDEAPWPVDLGECRLWPMEGEDGPLLQELFEDLSDFRAAFGEPGAADAVSTFLALPEGVDYDSKLLLGLWRNGGLVGALDCIMGYPTSQAWTVGLMAVAQRHRRQGVATAVLAWLEDTAAGRGASTVRIGLRGTNEAGYEFLVNRGYAEGERPTAAGHRVMTKTVG